MCGENAVRFPVDNRPAAAGPIGWRGHDRGLLRLASAINSPVSCRFIPTGIVHLIVSFPRFSAGDCLLMRDGCEVTVFDVSWI